MYFIVSVEGYQTMNQHLDEGTDPVGPIKIGIARDVDARMRELQCGNPNELVLLGTVPGGRSEEARIHRHLNYYRLRGEWFSYLAARRVKAMIESGRAELEPDGWAGRYGGDPVNLFCASCTGSGSVQTKW